MLEHQRAHRDVIIDRTRGSYIRTMIVMQPIVAFGLGTLLVLVSALGRYAWIERRHRARWHTIADGGVATDGAGGPYRAGAPLPRYLRRAPPLVRFAAWTSFFVAGMLAPLALLAFWRDDLVMLLALGPPLLAAGALRRAGRSLLRRETRRAWFRVLDANRSIIWAHGFTLALVLVATMPTLGSFVGLDGEARLLLALLSILSLVEVLFVRSVAQRYQDALFEA
jgi:hypothetical protein